jgi:hypothetical protein
VLGAVSVTLTLAPLANQAVDTYGSLISPVLPVSGLTRNAAWTLIAVLGLLVVLNGLGLSITPMLTALGVGGLATSSPSLAGPGRPRRRRRRLRQRSGTRRTRGRGRRLLGDARRAGRSAGVCSLRSLPTFADSSINLTVILRAREFVDQYLIKHEFVTRLHARFSAADIGIDRMGSGRTWYTTLTSN